MKVLLITLGTRGDVQPFTVIGSRLKAEGHDVHIAADTGFSQMITAEGLTHHPLPLDFQEIIQNPDMQAAITTLSGKFKAFGLASEIMNKQFSAMWHIGLDIAPELILYHFKGVIAPYLGRRLNVPAWPVMLQPGFTPTRTYPQFFLTTRQLGSMGNLVTHQLFGAGVRFFSTLLIKRWVKATSTQVGPIMDLQVGYSPDGSAKRLHAYSPQIAPLGSDMPRNDQQVGYAFADPAAFTPPSELTNFLSDGETPIYVGFGSMPGINHERVSNALVGALELTGLRAVIATGWGGIGELSSTAKWHVVDAVPHSWLFPKVAAVVHHGGSGTTHEGLRWGRPAVVCPLFADQPFFGQQVAQLGAGSAPIAQRLLTAENLAVALEYALSEKVAMNAKSVGDIVAKEDGAGNIVELVKKIEHSATRFG